MTKERLDKLLVARGLAETRQKAQALILAGQVRIGGRAADKPGTMVDAAAVVEILQPPPYVGRGGLKLEKALSEFQIPVAGAVAVDIGASTGGFTDCLLKFGVRKVYALDVGHGQLDWKLRNDARVVVREGLNARRLTPEDLPEPFQIVTMDLSFISVTLVLPALARVLQVRAAEQRVDIVVLVKPQFEVGKGQVGRGGIVRDESRRQTAIDRVAEASRDLGFLVQTIIESPILGAEGNKEFLMHVVRGPASRPAGHKG